MTTETYNDLFERTIAVSITIGQPSAVRKVSLSGVEVDADKDRLHLGAKILVCPEMKAIRSVFAKTRERILDAKKGLTLPALFKRGVALVPVQKVGEVESIMQEAKDELAVLVNDLINVYDQRVQEDRERLRSRFDQRHYPSKDALRSIFTIEWRYLQLTPSSQLRMISSDVYAKEVERVRAECDQLGEHVKATMRAAALELVQQMHDRLGYNADGTPKIFRNTTVSNLITYIDNFEFRNVTNDDELAAAMAQMSALLKGQDPDALRHNEGLRKAVADQTAAIVSTLETLVTEQARVVTLPDEDAA